MIKITFISFISLLFIQNCFSATFIVSDSIDTGKDPWFWGSYIDAPKTLRNATHFAETNDTIEILVNQYI